MRAGLGADRRRARRTARRAGRHVPPRAAPAATKAPRGCRSIARSRCRASAPSSPARCCRAACGRTTSSRWCRASRRVRVRGVQVHGRQRDEAVAGQRTAVNLGGIEVADIARGQSLVAPGSLTVTRRADAITRSAASRKAAEARRARALSSGHQGGARARLGRRPDACDNRAGIARRVRAPPRSARGAHARRSLHPSRLFADRDDRRRAGARSQHPPRARRTEACRDGTLRGAGDYRRGHAMTRPSLRMIADAGGAGLHRRTLVSRAGVRSDSA